MEAISSKVGVWAFLGGLILAILVAIFVSKEPQPWVYGVMAILGIVVALFNINDAEIQLFLIAGISFLFSVSALSDVLETVTLGWAGVATFFSLLSVFFAPAVAVVAVKALHKISKD